MANYTIAQAQQAMDQQAPDVGPPDSSDSASTDVGGSPYVASLDLTKLQWLASHGIDPFHSTDVEIAAALYRGGLGGPNEIAVLKDAGLITGTQAGNLTLPQDDGGVGAGGSNPNSQLKKIGGAYYNYDPADGSLTPALDANGDPLTALTAGGGTSAGRAAPNKQAIKVGNQYYVFDPASGEFVLALDPGVAGIDPQQQFENDLATRQANFADRGQDASILSNRASAGINTADLVRNLANDQYQRALDPGNYPAYLAASAGLPQGSGSPISALLGQGAQITPPEGGNPLADPRFQNLLGSEYTYGTVPDPAGVGTVRDIATANGGQLPQAFYDYTHTVNPNAQAHATGGSELVGNSVAPQVGPTAPIPASMSAPGQVGGPQGAYSAVPERPSWSMQGNPFGAWNNPQMLHGPVVGIPAGQLQRGQIPQFLAGEAGPEKLTFTPMHHHESMGLPTPHQHEGGHAKHEHMGPMIRYEDGGSAITGVDYANGNADGQYTPSEGSAVSLAKALQPLGYVPPYVISQLASGRAPTPGSIDEETLSRLPPSLRALLQAQIKSQVGNAGLMDYNFQLEQNALPGGLNNGITSTVYSG